MPLNFADRINLAPFLDWQDFVSHNEATTVSVAPTFVVAPGFTLIGVWSFAPTVLNGLTGTFEMMHDYAEGSDIFPHIHWSPSSGAAGNVVWEFVFSSGDPFGEFSAQITLRQVVAANGLGANGRPIHVPLEMGQIEGDLFRVGTQVRFSILRQGADAADTYPDGALLWATGMHFQMDTIGSRNRFTK